MKSIPLALTWEFWRQAWWHLLWTIMVQVGFMALIYRGLLLDIPFDSGAATQTALQLFCFVFVMVAVVAVVCGAIASPQYRFTLPVSMRASILIPMLNGAFATAISYLAVALLVNGLYGAHWTFVKPTLFAVCLFAVCQAVAWMIWSSPNLRAVIIAGVCPVLVVAIFMCVENTIQDSRQLARFWSTIQPLEVFLAVLIPPVAYFYSLGILTLARRGQVLSMTVIGRWLLAKLDITFAMRSHRMTPMAAESWSEWIRRGRPLLAAPVLIAATLCGFFLSGRYGWTTARDVIIALTWMQVMFGSILGLFIGHVGERFDFRENLATLPLSDVQLADVKLRISLKVVSWTWILWAIGVAVAVLCLAIIGQGPKSWSDIVSPETPLLRSIVNVVMIPLCSWTLVSLGVSIVILRPWMVKALLVVFAWLPAVPFGLLYMMPALEAEILAASQWSWIGLTIGGTVALYATAFRLRLISARRVAIVGTSYMLLCATWLLSLSYLTSIGEASHLSVGYLLSNCILPFVCIAAVPLTVWWNRHR